METARPNLFQEQLPPLSYVCEWIGNIAASFTTVDLGIALVYLTQRVSGVLFLCNFVLVNS